MLEIGSKAPYFSLANEKGEIISLKDFKGHKVILYFYPKDNTPGCTKEALAFKELFAEFEKRDVIVIAVSKDNSRSHLNFKTKHDLPFILLADPEHQVIEAYDVWKEKKLYGKVSMGTVRSTYVIDEDGVIIKSYPKVKVNENAKEVLAFLDSQA